MGTLEAARHARLRALFHAAVELPAEEREALAAGLDDAALAADLRSLLAAHEAAGEALTAGLAAHRRELAEEMGAGLDGRRVGPYELVRLLGRGGMGAVYLGRRADGAFQQEVAIKLLRSELASPELVHRFHSERQTLASLSHPNIARLLDGGATAEGLPYLVMEHVDGVPFEEHCATLGLRERLALFATVCDAVAEAHRNLIVHRDLKPGNLLVAAGGTVKLLDFGIAKLLGTGGEETLLAQSFATFAYASPEQVAGGAVTTATDVYSLGVILYRLLAGRHPYELGDRSLAAAARVISEEMPPPPSKLCGDRRRARLLAGDLDAIALTALRKEPARRYGSVADLAADVRRHLAGLPVTARPDTFGYRFGKLVRRHRAAAVLGALALITLLSGLAAYAWEGRLVRAEARRAQVERTRAEQVSAFLEQMLASADPLRGGGRRVAVADVLDRASQRLAAGLAGQPEVEASLRRTLGETYLNLGLSREAERELRRALALAAGAPAASGRQLAVRVLLGQALSDEGRWEMAERELAPVLDLCRRTRRPPLACVEALDDAMMARQNLGRAAAAEEAGRAALALLRASFPHERGELASVLNNLAIIAGNQGDPERAEPLHRAAVAAARAAYGERHPRTAEATANLAGVLDMEGRYAEAAPLYRQALAVETETLGEGHLATLRTLTSYANLLWLMHQPAAAEPHARRAASLALATLGSDHPLTAYAETVLGSVLLDEGRPAEAEPHVRAALAARRRLLPPGHWLIASAQSNLGATLLALGRTQEAERELLAAYAALVAGPGPRHERARLTAGRLARLYASRGDAAAAHRYRALAAP